ncbi:MAG TPA: CDC27 family protein [Longimicrobium sp.]|nr:CDC27 family protein [Longimicrobium sp.]
MTGRGMGIALLALLLTGGAVREGNRHYRNGDYARAAQSYARALAEGDSSAVVRYNLGTALLRLGRYDEARPHLEAAARRGLRRRTASAEYNAGNADLAPAAAGRLRDEARVEALRRAVSRYRRALLRSPGDADAKWNLELAQRLLDRERRGGAAGAQPQADPQAGGEPGESDEPPQPADPQPRPQETGEGDQPPMTREEAERVLDRAGRRESELQKRMLKREQERLVGVRDW